MIRVSERKYEILVQSARYNGHVPKSKSPPLTGLCARTTEFSNEYSETRSLREKGCAFDNIIIILTMKPLMTM